MVSAICELLKAVDGVESLEPPFQEFTKRQLLSARCLSMANSKMLRLGNKQFATHSSVACSTATHEEREKFGSRLRRRHGTLRTQVDFQRAYPK